MSPVYWMCRSLSAVVLRVWCGFRIEGAQHVPPSGPFIVAANHISYLDPPAVGASFRRQLHFIAKDDLFRMPVLGWLVTQMGAISVTLSQPDAVNTAVLKTSLRHLQRGQIVAIFPEGRRNTTGQIEPAKLGIAFMALRAGVPIVPVAVIGTDKALPPGAKMLRHHPITVRIGPPIRAAQELSGRQAHHQLAERVTTVLKQLYEMQ